ncbi:MAG: endonuclease III [Phycisphaeraceae bacterium]|nr:endonuclease III [Phycisphaeraceae bacterium]
MARKKTTSARKKAPGSHAQEKTRKRAATVYRKLKKQYPDAHCALDHRNAYQLLMATILSAQCTDERVNKVTPDLFKKYPKAANLARARTGDVEKLIRSTGFYRNKTKSLIGSAKDITEQHNGQVPDTMEDLLQLRGVARKTANVILGNAYDKNEGVVVDTHVKRLSRRLGLSRATSPEKIEKDLMQLFPRKNWCMLSHLLIWHGRRVCKARKPDCRACVLESDCPKVGVETS